MKCYNYVPLLVHYILPTSDFLKYLCYSRDKTNLFIVSFVRFIISLIIYQYCSDLSNVKIGNFTGTSIKYYTLVYILVNFCILVYVYHKRQKYPQKDEDE